MIIPTQYVLAALLAEPDREYYGAGIGHVVSLTIGTIHPIRARFEAVRPATQT